MSPFHAQKYLKRMARAGLAVVLVLCAIAAEIVIAKPSAKKAEAVKPANLDPLKNLDDAFQKQSMKMKVAQTTKSMIGTETKHRGTMVISKGRLRMELDGEPKSLLVVNKNNLWAVTYPDEMFKDSKFQVIKANVSTKKGRAKNPLSVLSQGGFFKFFIASGSQKEANGDFLFFLSPRSEETELRRAQVRVSPDGKSIRLLKYWDTLENEVQMDFSDVEVVKSVDEKLFDYTPPKNADVLAI